MDDARTAQHIQRVSASLSRSHEYFIPVMKFIVDCTSSTLARSGMNVMQRDTSDPFDLERFVDAQAAVYDRVVDELKSGRKRGHWIWFIFPQVAGLGFSHMSQKYAITSLAEAEAYAKHELLGPQLRECAQMVLDLAETHIERILPPPDDLKFRSSMTLFSLACPQYAVFRNALAKYFGGEPDAKTVEILERL